MRRPAKEMSSKWQVWQHWKRVVRNQYTSTWESNNLIHWIASRIYHEVSPTGLRFSSFPVLRSSSFVAIFNYFSCFVEKDFNYTTINHFPLKRRSMEINLTLEFNLEIFHADLIWGFVGTTRTGPRAPRRTDQVLPGTIRCYQVAWSRLNF